LSPIPTHRMHENQIMMRLEGPLSQPERLISCRSGVAHYRSSEPGTQRCKSQRPDEELVNQAWMLDRTVRGGLRRFDSLEGSLNLQILSRRRNMESEAGPVSSTFAGFWGTLRVKGAWPTIFGNNNRGELVFRRGPWEDWPRRSPALQTVDPSLPLLLSPYCGTLFHEAVGHALEAEYLERSPLKYRFGERITHGELTISDRPDLAGYAGSMGHDDVGLPVSSTTLVHRGHLVGDLNHDKGVLRRASYRELPQVRASNFIIKAGSANPNSWLHSLTRCYYISWIQSGNWRPGTDRIKIMTGPIFLLEKGRFRGYRDWAALEFTTADLLARIGGIGSDFTMDPAVHWCQKKNQAVPMGMGAPSILVRGSAS